MKRKKSINILNDIKKAASVLFKNGEAVNIMGDFERLCNEYRENKRMIEELTAMNDDIKAHILKIMAGNEVMREGAVKASYKTVITNRFNSSKFKEEYPGLYREYSTQVSTKRFTVS